MCKSCSNAGFTCFEGSSGAQPACLHFTRKADTPEPALECGGHVQRPGDIEALLQPHFFNVSCGFLWGCVSGKRCFHLKSSKLAIYGIFPGAKEYQPRVFFSTFMLPDPGVASDLTSISPGGLIAGSVLCPWIAEVLFPFPAGNVL